MYKTRNEKRILQRMRNNAEDFLYNNVVNTIIEKSVKKFKNHFGFDITYNPLENRNDIYLREIYKWIKKYYSNYSELFDNNMENGFIKDKLFVIKFSKDTYAYIATGNKINTVNKSLSVMKNINVGFENYLAVSNAIYIYIFGKHSKKYYDELNNNLKVITTEALYTFMVSGNKAVSEDNNYGISPSREVLNIIMSDLKRREMGTLFYDDKVKERVENHIDTFLKTKEIYVEKDIPFKTGIMLYGDPGTGKSSLAQAIANKYSASIVNVDMATFSSIDVVDLKESIEADNLMYIILLEDIDTLFNSLNRSEDEKLDKDDKKTINKLLQFLDSPTKSPTNVIFIATTNHIEKLDDAILRTGRFDIKIEVNPICKETAREMCESFKLSESTIDGILKNCTFPVVQSYLQGEILKAIKVETLKNSGNIDEAKDISTRKVIINEDGSSIIEDEDIEYDDIKKDDEA